MKVYKWIIFPVVVLLLLPVYLVNAGADEPEFCYELVVNGRETIEVNTGDVITVSMYLQRTDADEPYNIYAMQDEIRYDSNFFELVEDSVVLFNGIRSTEISVGGGFRELYMNFVSSSDDVQWEPEMCIGTFQLRVIASEGATTLTNEDYLVSHPDGMARYNCDANTLTVVVNNDRIDYDINNDGLVSEEDARLLMSILIGQTPTETLYDFDEDGKLTIYDCVLLMQQIA